MNSPYLRQLFVASSPQLAAISVGGVVGFPNVILEQLKANDSTIHLDLDMASWLGSTHGLAGIPSTAMPTIMQWRGRRFAFILSCLFMITGSILTYFSKNIITIIIGECFQGLANNSIVTVSYSTISEMVDPKFRVISMSFYMVNEALGITIVSIIGRYLHWRTVSAIMCIPIVLALIIACMWPETPAWLAYKEKYIKCEEVFRWLRGSDERAQKELKELLTGQKENSIANKNNKFSLKNLILQMTGRDFYMPCFHSFVIICTAYFNGSLIVVVYGIDIIRQATNNKTATHYGMIVIYAMIYFGTLASTVLMKFFKNKTIYLTSAYSASAFMLGASIVTFLQSRGVLPSDSLLCLYFIGALTISVVLGLSPIAYGMAVEIVPVKHRGLGGAIYIVIICTLHSLVLKTFPYLTRYIDLWGSFLLLFIIQCVCLTFVWKYIPETKGKTLQEIEDFYIHGRFVTRVREDVENLEQK